MENNNPPLISYNIKKGTDDVYRWVYEVNMWRDTSILLTVVKVMLISLAFPFLLVLIVLISDGDFSAESFLSFIKGYALVVLFIMALTVVCYYIVTLIYGGVYAVIFEMGEKQITHIQMNRSFKKAQAIAALTFLCGAVSGKPTLMGHGLLTGARNSMTSRYKNIKAIHSFNKKHYIKIISGIERNMIYTDEQDFNFVKNFIIDRCVRNVRVIEK